MNDTGAKQQIVDKIKNTTNILVTVSKSPSVDELSAALGLTILLNTMEKRATAVFSGDIPPAITFLDPEKTFENTVDSLRDFIIALDKEKADHLRYKVDGEVVKIFITPYRTTISKDDLEFSQGDYNVELVLALGVKNRDHLDQALAAHGRILHDAAVATLGIGSQKSDLGTIDWTEEHASSLSEMMVSLSDALKADKPLIDQQTATAFLTGLVAATDRFSNEKTSSRVMTMAAQLMSAGANQQLIASKLQAANEISAPAASKKENSDGTTNLAEGKPSKVSKKVPEQPVIVPDPPEPPKPENGELAVSHEKEGTVEEVSKETEAENQAAAVKKAEAELKEKVETTSSDDTLTKELSNVLATAAASTPSVEDLKKDLASASADVSEAAKQADAGLAIDPVLPTPLAGAVSSDVWQDSPEPTLGGTLNATTAQAADDKRKEASDTRNHTILNHDEGAYVGDKSPTFQSPLNAATSSVKDEPNDVNVFQGPVSAGLPSDNQATAIGLDFEPAPIPAPKPPVPSLTDIDTANRATDHSDAKAAVQAAYGAQPFNPANQPQANIGAQPLGTITHDTVTTSPVSPALPPMPDFSTLPPLPTAQPFGAQPTDETKPAPETLGSIIDKPAATPSDPGQFKIPGQN